MIQGLTRAQDRYCARHGVAKGRLTPKQVLVCQAESVGLSFWDLVLQFRLETRSRRGPHASRASGLWRRSLD